MLDPSALTRRPRGQSTSERQQRRVRNTVRRLNLKADDPDYLCVERGLRHSVHLGETSQIPGYLPWFNQEEQLWELHSPRTQQRRAFQQQADFDLSLEQYLEYISEEEDSGAAASSTTAPANPQPQQQPPADFDISLQEYLVEIGEAEDDSQEVSPDQNPQQPPADEFYSAAELESFNELLEEEEEAEGYPWSFPPQGPPPSVGIVRQVPKPKPSTRPSSADETRRLLEELDAGIWAPQSPDTTTSAAASPTTALQPAPQKAEPFRRPPPEWLDQGGSPPSAEDPYTGPSQQPVAFPSSAPAQDNTLQVSTDEARSWYLQRPSLRPQKAAALPTKRDRPADPPKGTSKGSQAKGSIGSAAKRKLNTQQYSDRPSSDRQRGQLSLGLRKGAAPLRPKVGVKVTSWYVPDRPRQPAPPPPPPFEGPPKARVPEPLPSPPQQLARASLPRALQQPKVKVAPTQPPPPPTLGTTQQDWFGPQDAAIPSSGSGGHKAPPAKPKPPGIPKSPPNTARGSTDPPPAPAAPKAATTPPRPTVGPLTGGIVPESQAAFSPAEHNLQPPPAVLDLRLSGPRLIQQPSTLTLPTAHEVIKVFALDLHHTLDRGDEHSTLIPEAATALEAVEQHLGGREVAPFPWICSYIGRSTHGTDPQRALSLFRRRQAYDRIAELAVELGKQHCCSHALVSVIEEVEWTTTNFPSAQALYLGISDRKLVGQSFHWPHKGWWLNGKVYLLRSWDTWVIFDDSIDVAKETSQYGILCYHLTTSGSKKFSPEAFHNNPRVSSFHSWPSLASALEAFCSDFDSGLLVYKIHLLNPTLFASRQ